MSTHEQLITTLEERQARLDKICIKFGKRADQTHSQAAAALREEMQTNAELRGALRAVDANQNKQLEELRSDDLLKIPEHIVASSDIVSDLCEHFFMLLKVADTKIVTQDTILADLRAKLAEAEIRQVGFTAEIAGLKSKGPFILDETNPHLIYCEDEFVYLDPSNLQGVCDKLNQLTSDNARLRKAIEEAIEQKDSQGEVISILRNALEGGE